MKTNNLNTIIMTFLLLLSTFVYADKRDETQINHLSLATLMIYDASYDKAKDELALVNKSAKEFDESKYYTIKGVLATKTKNYKDAIVNYNKAINATKAKEFKAPKIYTKEKYLFSIGASKEVSSPSKKFDAKAVKKEKLEKLYLYLAQSYYKVDAYKNTVISLDLAGDKGSDRASLYALRAECYYKSKDYHNAIEALNTGAKLFPKDTTLLKQKFYYLASLKLYQSAIKNAKVYMNKIDADAKEYVLLAQLLIEASQVNEAIKILEFTKVKFPKNAKVKMLLGHMYLQQDMPRTTAYMFKLASYNNSKYLSDAVEMHRRVKDYSHAIFLNTGITDKVEKIKQKVAIYLERGEYEKVIGLKNALKRYNILEDDNMRYALAYAYYMAKDYEMSQKHLKQIRDNELFIKATLIRKNIQMCEDNSMECI